MIYQTFVDPCRGRDLGVVAEVVTSVEGLEGVRLSQAAAIVPGRGASPRPVADAAAALLDAYLATGDGWIGTDGQGRMVSIGIHDLPEELAPGGVPVAVFQVNVPEDAAALARAPDLMRSLAVATNPWWASTAPTRAGARLNVPDPGSGLPTPRPWRQLSAPSIPYLGWIQYWSAATAAAIGFVGVAPWAYRIERTGEGWLVQLTADPLDLDRAEHLDAVRAAYAACPAIGGG